MSNPINKIVPKILTGVDNLLYSKVFVNRKPELSSSNKNILLEIFKNDICDTEKLLNVDLTLWKK